MKFSAIIAIAVAVVALTSLVAVEAKPALARRAVVNAVLLMEAMRKVFNQEWIGTTRSSFSIHSIQVIIPWYNNNYI
ncbi:hypothetical protein BDF22DRAFT_739549 [Syncephalis plumigaleata]|nr:hypothetical protein BDF22DRAFT_739549 [Syncephalis plumigaleata]